jgi:hypothetical protein
MGDSSGDAFTKSRQVSHACSQSADTTTRTATRQMRAANGTLNVTALSTRQNGIKRLRNLVDFLDRACNFYSWPAARGHSKATALIHDNSPRALMTDLPKLLADPQARADRRAKLHESHIAPLTAFVEALRHEVGPGAAIPDLDPWDGGVDAEILYLLEAPGPQAVASGFISRNNPDETAKNFFQLNAEAKIPRKRTVTWNVVPWYIGDSKAIRAARRPDLQQGIHLLPKLLSLLPKLRAVVFVGRKAEYARETVVEQLPNVKVYYCPHPSPRCLNTNPANRRRIIEVLREVATATSQGVSSFIR